MREFTKTDTGLIICHKNDSSKAWGNIYYDAQGWVDVLEATVYRKDWLHSPTGVVHPSNTQQYNELFNYGKIVEVEIVTTITLKES